MSMEILPVYDPKDLSNPHNPNSPLHVGPDGLTEDQRKELINIEAVRDGSKHKVQSSKDFPPV